MYKNLEYIIKIKKLKAKYIAEYLDISNSAFSQFRHGKSTLADETLERLSNFLGYSIEEITDQEEFGRTIEIDFYDLANNKELETIKTTEAELNRLGIKTAIHKLVLTNKKN